MLSSLVIGGGPGGLGPLIWAAQNGSLPDWLDRGVAVIERQGHLGGTLGRFGIHSDSLGGSYLECLEAPGLPPALLPLREDPLAHEMALYRHSFPPLALVNRFMCRIGTALAEMLADYSALHLRTEARALRLSPDGSVALEIIRPDQSHATLHARSAVVALGGRQFWPQQMLVDGLRISDCRIRRVMPSDRALSSHGLAEADRILSEADGRKILILGGSHSAYSVAGAFLGLRGAERLADGQMVILQRRDPRIFYPDQQAARDDHYEVDPGDICPRTQRVNRMGGLRGYGREMWRQIAKRPGATPEPRVVVTQVRQLAVRQLRAMIEEAALVVPCFGYRSATLPVYDATGQRLALNADAGGEAVGENSRLLLADGTTLPNVFGIGLGTGYRLPPSMGGEPNFNGQANSLWLYQNDIGGVIYRTIHELLAQPAAIAAWAGPITPDHPAASSRLPESAPL
jgi:hypothetical protein